jgi:hypothetical protein
MIARSSLVFRSLRFAPALVVSLHALPAFASPVYPITIQTQLGLAKAPDCTLCHHDDNGGAGTVVRPFGRTMTGRFGLVGGSNIAALKSALEGDDAEHVDSDGDGVPDIDELRAGTDPNVGVSGVESSDVPLPETGCSLPIRAATRSAKAWLFGLLMACARFASLRRRRTSVRRAALLRGESPRSHV